MGTISAAWPWKLPGVQTVRIYKKCSVCGFDHRAAFKGWSQGGLIHIKGKLSQLLGATQHGATFLFFHRQRVIKL
jgi:hypothetical protein